MNILLTGGAGYIGSHTAVSLLEQGHQITILDNFSNAKPQVLDRIREITGKTFRFYQADVRDRQALDLIFRESPYDAVIHFAGLKAVGESVRQPMAYYDNNVAGTLTLCEQMDQHNLRNIVFSSSATVYGEPETVPIQEESPRRATNPYGRTKLMIEEILQDLAKADPRWQVTLLRYFNPIGAHESGRIGENPNGIPNNLMPYITQVAVGKQEKLKIFGGDYPTPDGTGVRDYIHVMDLAIGHVKALEKSEGATGCSIYNLGTGVGYSVLEVVKAFETANDLQIPYEMVPRRPGDAAACYGDVSKAFRELNWKARFTLEDMCRHAWNWQKNNPDGY